MKKNKLSRYFIFISSITLLSIWLMVIYNSYHKLTFSLTKAKMDPAIRQLADPAIDLEVAREIERRLEYHQSDLIQAPLESTPPAEESTIKP